MSSTIIIWIYLGIAHGCNDAGWSIWRSLGWPTALGRCIARATAQGEAQG